MANYNLHPLRIQGRLSLATYCFFSLFTNCTPSMSHIIRSALDPRFLIRTPIGFFLVWAMTTPVHSSESRYAMSSWICFDVSDPTNRFADGSKKALRNLPRTAALGPTRKQVRCILIHQRFSQDFQTVFQLYGQQEIDRGMHDE